MKHLLLPLTVLVLSSTMGIRAEDAPGNNAPRSADSDPFAPYLRGQAPTIARELPVPDDVPGNITVRRLTFHSKDNSEIFAMIATPKLPGKHPGMLVLHGGGGIAAVEQAMAWAQRGYVAVAPDLPGIANPLKLTETKGRWSDLKYGEGRWTASPDAGASVIFDAVLSAMQSLYLLRDQPTVDTARIGVVGISWGGYMTTMVCGLAGEQVRAGFALYGCGFFDKGSQKDLEPYDPKLPQNSLTRMPDAERDLWLKHLDAGRRIPGMKAAFFLAAASNDFFGWPGSVQATIEAIPFEKNQVIAPNANHKIPLPGGSVFDKTPTTPFVPTAFQPYPTPSGNKANWVAMEVPYFEYYLKGLGAPFPKIQLEASAPPRSARFTVQAPVPLTKTEIYWSKPAPPKAKQDDILKREWFAVPAEKNSQGSYEAALPPEAGDWFAVVSDERPVSVSSNIVHVEPISQ